MMQKFAWPCLVRRKDDFIGVAPTGSGKTWAYLVPALISARIAQVGRYVVRINIHVCLQERNSLTGCLGRGEEDRKNSVVYE